MNGDTVSSTPVVGPMLTRVGGLPATTMNSVIPEVAHLLADVVAAEQRLAELAPSLIDTLYALVPQLDDDIDLRRRVLTAKRAVNRLAPLGWTDELRRRFADRAGLHAAVMIQDWTRVVSNRDALMTKLDDELRDHRGRAAESLVRLLEDHSFIRSLAVAAPDWLRHGYPVQPNKVKGRTLQTLYSYAARAALKTSPFSGLTTVGVPGRVGSGVARSRTSVTVAYLALLRLARDPRLAPVLTYRLAEARPGGPDEPNGLLIHSEFTVADGTVWRADRVVEADEAARWIEAVPAGRRDRIAFKPLLQALGGTNPWARFRRLLDSGVIQPIPPWGDGGAPLQVLSQLAESGEAGNDLGDDLEYGHQEGAAVAGLDVSGRLRAAAFLQILVTELIDTDTAARPGGVIYEDRESDLNLMDPSRVPAVREDLEAVGRLIRPHIFRSHLYDLLLEQFVASYGAGGTCADPLGFLMRLSVDRDANHLVDSAVGADHRARSNPVGRSNLPVGPSSAPPTAGLLFQIAADDMDAVLNGRYHMVLNHFSSGTGGLFGRFARLLGEDFRQSLLSYVEHCWPGVERRQLLYWTDCNTAQAECAGLLPPLLLPGEVPTIDGITLDTTLLTHDPATDTLTLRRQDGTAIGLGYLGLIPQHLLQSYVRLLAVLADPWINASPHTDYTLTKFQELAPHLGQAVSALPRTSFGRVVTRRRSWIVPTDQIPGPRDGQGDAQLLLDLERFRQQHGMPEEVFAHQLSGGGFPMGGTRKPMWVSLRSPLSVEVLHQWIDPRTRHIRIVEALPDRDHHYQPGHNAEPVVTEHAVLLAWQRPGDTQ